MITHTPAVAQFKTEFERARRWRRGHREPLQFGDIRWEALDRFLSLGFPTVGDEEWRFTSVTPIAEKIFTLTAQPESDANRVALPPSGLPDQFGTELVFVNGYCLPDASTLRALPSGVRVEPLSEILDSSATDVASYLARVATFQHSAFVALNTALFADGACILIPAHTVVEEPIHVRFISTGEADMRPAMSNPRVLLVLDNASRATIVESYVGPKGVQYFTNVVTEIVLGENAALDHYKLQCESKEAYHTSATYAVAGSGANCSAHSISLGGALVRNDVVAVLGGEGVKCTLNGLYLADRERLVDNHTTIDHMMPHCRSQQVYNGILADRARSVFGGKIMVGADALKTHAKQTNRALLLSQDARINSTSNLENFAKGVNFTQRFVGRQIDEEAAFYTQSRGMGDAEAHRLVILAFVRDMLNGLPLQSLTRGVKELLRQQLEGMLRSVPRSGSHG
jgi:Fe-S cluster assembly protein SufD